MQALTFLRCALILAVGALVAWASGANQPARAIAAPLFLDASLAAQQERPQDRSIVRSRYTRIADGVLPGPDERRTVRQPVLPLELFPGVTLFAEFVRFDPHTNGVTWVGQVEGEPMSTVTLASGGGLLSGSIVTPAGAFRIRPADAELREAYPDPAGQLHIIEQVDQAAHLPEAEPIEVTLPPSDSRAAATAAVMGDTDGFIDLMVVYTASAAAQAGGTSGILNLINLGVSETNTSFSSSGVNQRIRLVHTAQVPYAETSSFSLSLTDLRLANGDLSSVATLRDAHAADLVMLLVRPTSPDACGIAYLMTNVSPAFAPFGFSVVDTTCVSPNYTFAHELGHNMGLRHDWFMDAGTTPFTFAHGHVNPAVGQRWRTIMAYPNLCTALGVSCTRLLRWSNPDERHLTACDGRFNCGLLQYWYFPGVPMGVAGGTRTNCQPGNTSNFDCDADERRALNSTAAAVANFRQSVVGSEAR